jgi:hypothetical protein
MAIDLTGIANENEFYTHHYLAAILEGDLKPLFEAWSQQERPPWGGPQGARSSLSGDAQGARCHNRCR